MDETSPKDLIKVIRGNKGLTALAIGGAVLLLLYLYKQSQAVAGGAATSTAPTATGFAPAMGTYTYVEDIHQGAGPQGPIGATGAPGPQGPIGAPGPTGAPGVAGKPIILPPVILPPVKKPPAPKPAPAPKPDTSHGLLGAGIRFFPKYKNGLGYYRGPLTKGQIIPIPLPANTVYSAGADGRMYYQSPPGSQKKLLGS